MFYKFDDRPQSNYKFYLYNVMDDGLFEDYENYDLTLTDPIGNNYYNLTSQEDIITIEDP